jgi:holliday junction DNA helicase RuvA
VRYDTYMIRHIRGTLVSLDAGRLVIEAQGLGYEVIVSSTTAITAHEGDTIMLHTYHAVREDSETLYGFATPREREMFMHLIDLPGIGPKSAMGILSQADVRLLEEAAQRNDAPYLSKLSGIGKKSAEKIVQGLKDKVVSEGIHEQVTEDNDVIDALIALGYSHEEARRALRDLPAHAHSTKDRLKEALKTLGSS